MRKVSVLTRMILLAVVLLAAVWSAVCEKNTTPRPPTPVARPLVKPPLKWVNLLTGEMNTWMGEAGRAANEACGQATAATMLACVHEKVPAAQRIRTWTIPLSAGPSKQSEPAGAIRVTGKFLEGFSLEYLARDGTAAAFQPDNPLQHADSEAMLHTVLEEREGWVLLPLRPFPSEVWMEAGPQFPVLEVGPGGDVFNWNGRNIVILEAMDSGVVAREEIPADFDCGDGAEKTPEDKIKKFSIPWSGLYDKDNHLRLTQKYTMC